VYLDKYRAANVILYNILIFICKAIFKEDVIHSISALSKLRYADFDKSRSIFSAEYQELPRMVNGKPYGEVQPLQYATENKADKNER
jgi:hypothetical protein